MRIRKGNECRQTGCQGLSGVRGVSKSHSFRAAPVSRQKVSYMCTGRWMDSGVDRDVGVDTDENMYRCCVVIFCLFLAVMLEIMKNTDIIVHTSSNVPCFED